MGRLKALAKKDVFDPYEPTFEEVYVSNEEGAEILEHIRLRKFTKEEILEKPILNEEFL